jgi:1-deoxy-D-xylulose-5-phosphate reductoisomerase
VVRRITILGATGSIGRNTVALLRGRSDIKVTALTGGRDIAGLAELAREFRPDFVATAYPELFGALREALQGAGLTTGAGPQAILDAAARPADWVMSAIVGAAGLPPGLEALKHGKCLALANKESLVTAGPLLLKTARQHGATILPVDSEHSAVFQCLGHENYNTVESVTITASGGPFRAWPFERLAQATLAEALRHPNFAMGQRITIDSASMFNKALELIETREYFGFAPDQIKVLVHPEQIIHGLVQYVDGGMLAHMGAPDMRHSIAYALNWPDRGAVPVERIDLATLGALTFERPDEARFPALRLAREVMETGGVSGAVLNAAKEVALDAFISGQIRFTGMAELVERVLELMSGECAVGAGGMTLETVTEADRRARELALTTVNLVRT